jgi:hypothetical protein
MFYRLSNYLINMKVFCCFSYLLVIFSLYFVVTENKKLSTDSDFLDAAGNGNVDRVEALLKENGVSLSAKNNYGVRSIALIVFFVLLIYY